MDYWCVAVAATGTLGVTVCAVGFYLSLALDDLMWGPAWAELSSDMEFLQYPAGTGFYVVLCVLMASVAVWAWRAVIHASRHRRTDTALMADAFGTNTAWSLALAGLWVTYLWLGPATPGRIVVPLVALIVAIGLALMGLGRAVAALWREVRSGRAQPGTRDAFGGQP